MTRYELDWPLIGWLKESYTFIREDLEWIAIMSVLIAAVGGLGALLYGVCFDLHGQHHILTYWGHNGPCFDMILTFIFLIPIAIYTAGCIGVLGWMLIRTIIPNIPGVLLGLVPKIKRIHVPPDLNLIARLEHELEIAKRND